MKNRERWVPSKFIYRNGKLIASRDPHEVGAGSRLMVDVLASFFDAYITKDHVRGRLLDLGCGKVPLFQAYQPYITENICVDWENAFFKNQHVDFECDLTKPLPFQDGEFDTIILSDVLEHIPTPDLLWKEIRRVLSLGGKVLVTVPFLYWIHDRPYDYYRYTEFALRRSIESAGLKLVLLKSLGGAPEALTDIIAKTLDRVPKVGGFLAIGLQWVAVLLLKTRLGKRVSAATSSEFPLGYFLIAERS